MGAVLNSSRYNAAHHWFTFFVACLAFLLLVAGGLVTSNNAGLAVPDWPTSFGSFYKMPRMVGGVKFEHGHRMIAELVGLLTIYGVDELQPTLSLVATTVAHLGTGALMLAFTAIVTIQAYRYSGNPAQVLLFSRNREVASA